MRRLEALLAAGVLLLALGAQQGVFGGFVGSAGTNVQLAADSLDRHVSVTPGSPPDSADVQAAAPAAAGALRVRNVSSDTQRLALALVGATADQHAGFRSSGSARATLEPGATDSIDVTGPEPVSVRLALAVVGRDGLLFPYDVVALVLQSARTPLESSPEPPPVGKAPEQPGSQPTPQAEPPQEQQPPAEAEPEPQPQPDATPAQEG